MLYEKSFAIHPTLTDLISKLKYTNYLESITQELKKFGIITLIGSEIEFYLKDISIEELQSNLPQYLFYLERGSNQYEYNLGPTFNSVDLVNEITASINLIYHTAVSLGGKAIFIPKPYINDYGNALQFQMSFQGVVNKELIHNLASYFCEKALETCAAFLGTENDYQRLDTKYMAPTHIAWGYNNRSCLIRITGSYNERIEHRLASPINDPYLILAVILTTIRNFLANPSKTILYPRIWGNASDPQYVAEKLPSSLNQAITLFNYNFFVIH